MKLKLRISRILSILLFMAVNVQMFAEVPKVSNVRASQRDGTKIVDIKYDVEDAENDKLLIRVQISADGGETFNVPARQLTGDLGNDIEPGKNKTIQWDAGRDWDGEFSDKMRVRITASDRKGLPGLEWSKEIPPGGFLMGQDGGVEGSGASVHINVNYSYWISKYKITNNQFCDFLNLAYAAGAVNKNGTLTRGKHWQFVDRNYFSNEIVIVELGDHAPIRWNLNRFEVNKKGNHAVVVSMHGATAFAKWYDFNIPTEFHWEKAARGEFDDAGEHRKYAWGNDKSVWFAADKPVGWFDGINTSRKIENYFGIYDLTGHDEWVHTESTISYDSYPSVKYIRDYYDENGNRVMNPIRWANYKVVGYDMIHHRGTKNTWQRSTFRVLRIKKP